MQVGIKMPLKEKLNYAYLKGLSSLVSMMYHSNISRDILDIVIYLCTETICDIVSF